MTEEKTMESGAQCRIAYWEHKQLVVPTRDPKV